ncbi:MAG: restriction endonuclease subunit S [Legionella sp.]|nr:restriction endonuclease subunit S [Legionella sp.]
MINIELQIKSQKGFTVNEWRTLTIGEFCPFYYGKALTQPERKKGNIPVVSSAGITGFHNKALVDSSGIIIGRKGTVGNTTLCDEPFWAIDTAFYILDDPQKRDLYFTYYLLKNLDFSAMNSDSAVPGLNRDHAHAMLVKVPSIKEQKKIANILRIFDLRIELLKQTNTTLESIAQALFKSWFIDFDPVHAKAEGREPEGMDAETAALFPDGFEETDLGLVPKGWGEKAVYDIATYINGASYRSFEPNDERRGLPIIKIAELKSGVTTQTRYSSVNMPDKYKINYEDILFSWSGNPDTSIDTFIWSQGAAWLNQHIFRVLPHSNQERSFVFMTLRYLKPVFAEIARNKQTTGLGHVTIADLKRLKIVTPPSTILDKWNAVVTPILDQAFIMDCRSKILSHLRDTLLPRLISGQLIPNKVGEMA